MGGWEMMMTISVQNLKWKRPPVYEGTCTCILFSVMYYFYSDKIKYHTRVILLSLSQLQICVHKKKL